MDSTLDWHGGKGEHDAGCQACGATGAGCEFLVATDPGGATLRACSDACCERLAARTERAYPVRLVYPRTAGAAPSERGAYATREEAVAERDDVLARRRDLRDQDVRIETR